MSVSSFRAVKLKAALPDERLIMSVAPQIAMRSARDDLALLHHDDLVCALDGPHAMRDDQNGAVL